MTNKRYTLIREHSISYEGVFETEVLITSTRSKGFTAKALNHVLAMILDGTLVCTSSSNFLQKVLVKLSEVDMISEKSVGECFKYVTNTCFESDDHDYSNVMIIADDILPKGVVDMTKVVSKFNEILAETLADEATWDK